MKSYVPRWKTSMHITPGHSGRRLDGRRIIEGSMRFLVAFLMYQQCILCKTSPISSADPPTKWRPMFEGCHSGTLAKSTLGVLSKTPYPMSMVPSANCVSPIHLATYNTNGHSLMTLASFSLLFCTNAQISSLLAVRLHCHHLRKSWRAGADIPLCGSLYAKLLTKRRPFIDACNHPTLTSSLSCDVVESDVLMHNIKLARTNRGSVGYW
jgi:hypothetical protein